LKLPCKCALEILKLPCKAELIALQSMAIAKICHNCHTSLDVTQPKDGYPQWKLVEAKNKCANGIFRTRDDKGEVVFVSHTYQNQKDALRIANMLAHHYIAPETVVPLFL
jgi:hypothetical protein